MRKVAAAFKSELLSKTPTRAGLENSVKVDKTSMFSPSKMANIKYTPDGSIDKKSLVDYLKPPFCEAEEIVRQEIEKKLADKLSSGVELSVDEWNRANELSKRIANPFKGRYKSGDAA